MKSNTFAVLFVACIAMAGFVSATPIAPLSDADYVAQQEDADVSASDQASISPSTFVVASVQESATVSPVTISGASKPLGVAGNGLQLYQGTATWATFQNLPTTLVGLACMTSINEGHTKVSVVVNQATKLYMIKNDAWSNKDVDVSGWIQVDAGMYLAEAGWTAPAAYKLYSNIVPAGTHVLDTLSALFLFDTDWYQRQQMIAAGVDDGRAIVATIKLLDPFQKPLAVVASANGFQTYISGSSWGQYRNLPSYLVGTTAFTNVNEASSGYLVSFSLNYPTLAYLMRDNGGWNPVPMNGWEQVDAGSYLTTGSTMTVYKKILPSGTQSLNTGSAFYFFDLNWINQPANRMYAFADSVTITSGAAKPMGIAANGLQLYIPTPVWSVYQNLPTYLIGKLTTTSINDGSVCFNLKIPTKSYLMRAQSGWTPVDLSGWTLQSSGNYLSGYGQIDVYSKVLPQGNNCLSDLSAMYLFDIQYWQDGKQPNVGVDGDYRQKIDAIITSALSGVSSMLTTVKSVNDNAAAALTEAKTLYDTTSASLANAKTTWEAAMRSSDRSSTACTTATATRNADQSSLNSATVDWNSRKAQNQKELDMIVLVKKTVKDLVDIPATSSLDLSQHKASASDLANRLLQHSSERMQLVGQSLSMLLQTERSSEESSAILQLLDQLAAKLQNEQTTAGTAIKTFNAKLGVSSTAATTTCETSRISGVETATASTVYSALQNSLGDAKASLDKRTSDFNAAAADLTAATASYNKEKSYLDSFKTCGASAAASSWSGSTGSALFLADFYFSYYSWDNGYSPRLGNFFQNAFAAMTAGNKDALVVTSLKADRDSWTLDDTSSDNKFAPWIRSKAKTVTTINSVLELNGNVHVFIIAMDGQRSKVPILSDEEGAYLKRWVNNGGRLFAFIGHEAEKSPGYTKVGTGYAKWASTNFGLNFIDATMCLSPGTATPTSEFPLVFQNGPGGNINPNAGAAYTWTSNCHESFQLQSSSKGKIIMRGSGGQNPGYNYNCGSGDEACNLTTNVEAVYFGDGI